MKVVPPKDADGNGEDLNGDIDPWIQKAKNNKQAEIFVFGSAWDDSRSGHPDPNPYWTPNPLLGLHDVHMNQGDTGSEEKSNGIWQDGGLFIRFAAGAAGAAAGAAGTSAGTAVAGEGAMAVGASAVAGSVAAGAAVVGAAGEGLGGNASAVDAAGVGAETSGAGGVAATDTWIAMFFRFQNQSISTNDVNGNPK